MIGLILIDTGVCALFKAPLCCQSLVPVKIRPYVIINGHYFILH